MPIRGGLFAAVALILVAANVASGQTSASTRPDQPERGPTRLGPPPGEHQQAAYNRRIAPYLRVRGEWMMSTLALDAARAAPFAALRDREIAAAGERYASAGIPRYLKVPLDETIPGIFALPHREACRAGMSLDRLVGTELLDGSQYGRLMDELQSRDERFRRIAQQYVLSLLDEELYLTAAQRETIAGRWSPGAFGTPYYSFSPQDKALPQLFILHPGESAVSELLSPAQQALLERIRNQPAVADVVPDEDGAWLKKLERIQHEAAETVAVLTAVRIAALAREESVTQEQLDRLRTASRGAALLAGRQVVDSGRLISPQEQGQWAAPVLPAVPLAAPPPPVANFFPRVGRSINTMHYDLLPARGRTLSQFPLWENAWQKAVAALPVNLESERAARLLACRVDLVLELLDGELWLTPAQREQLRPLVEETLASVPLLPTGMEHARELVWLSRAIVHLPETSLAAVLSAGQLEVWRLLRSMYRVNNGEGSVSIVREDGGHVITLVLE